MLSLFPDEILLTESSDGSVTLTTQRIYKEEKQLGSSYSQSIMLEHITSCENSSKSQVWLLVLGLLLLILGLLAKSPVALVSIVFIGLYSFTKKSLVIISSPSTKMELKVNGMKQEQVQSFINKVEHAKHKRLLELNTR